MYKIFKIIAKVIGYLPLCGRLAIKPLLISAYSAGGSKKTDLVLYSYSILLILILGHSYQAKLGYEFFCTNSNVAIKVFMALYVIINIFVSYVQMFLFYRLSVHCIKNRHKFEKELKYHTYDFPVAQKVLFIVITLAGQLTFVALS